MSIQFENNGNRSLETREAGYLAGSSGPCRLADGGGPPAARGEDGPHDGGEDGDAAGAACVVPLPRPSTNSGAAKFKGSEDTIELSLYIKWGELWPNTLNILEKCKAASADENDPNGGFFDVGGWKCFVQPSGSKGKKRSPYRAFIVQAVGMRFEFSRAAEPNGQTPNGRVAAGSLTCMRLGAVGVLDLVKKFIQALGGELIANKVSRIDAAVDCPGIPVADFIDPFLAGHKFCRADKDNITRKHGRYETLRAGADLSIRIYDKLAEMADKPDAIKEGFIIENRYGGEILDAATRVEFQIRRRALKTMRDEEGFVVDSLEDYLVCRQGIWAYMCQWFRLTKDKVNPNHRDLAETSPLWCDVSASFEAWAASLVTAIDRKKVPRPVDDPALALQIVGCALSSCAASTIPFHGKADLLRAVTNLVDVTAEGLGHEELLDRFERKRCENATRRVPENERRPNEAPKLLSLQAMRKADAADRKPGREAC